MSVRQRRGTGNFWGFATSEQKSINKSRLTPKRNSFPTIHLFAPEPLVPYIGTNSTGNEQARKGEK